MSTTTLKYVGPHAEIEIAATGDFVARGDTVEVDVEVAGRAPTPSRGAEGDEDYVAGDPGEGLLAQPDNWQAAKAPKAPAAATSNEE